MLFSEVYGSYYDAVSDIINTALAGTLTRKKISEIVKEKCFGESNIPIPASLKDQRWPFIDANHHTTLRHSVQLPLTEIEKQWMKALLQDPRICLFDPDGSGLEDTRPLFSPADFVYYDQCADGDPYSDEKYIAVFRTMLSAIHQRKKIFVRFMSAKGELISWRCSPKALEYSAKDDKFRLRLEVSDGRERTMNVAQALECTVLDEPADGDTAVHHKTSKIVFELTDERGALERVMLHFSHLEKEVEKQSDKLYRVTVKYQNEDEKELVIRILSFGPVIKVISPSQIVDRVKKKLQDQLMLCESE